MISYMIFYDLCQIYFTLDLIFYSNCCILNSVELFLEGCFLSSSEFYFYFTLILQFLMVIFCIYFFIITIAGWNSRNSNEKRHKPKKSFALIVAAHNEEKVIANIVENLKNLKYPKELFDVFVIADNCTDNTAEIARNAGALVYERFNKVDVGKGYALRWMFDIIFEMDKKYDAISVFDADNLASKNYLQRMNDMLCNGHKAIQAYLDCKNPYDSWITLTNSIMYWSTNRMFNQSRHNLNMWCTIGGTGFTLDIDVLKQIPWDATCLAEDLEYTVKLTLADIRVSWCSDAAIYDEKPITFMQSWNQRKRWMQGHIDVFSRFFTKLMKKGFKEKRLTPIDLAVYNFQPLYIVISFLVSIIVSIISLNIHTYSVKEVIDSGLLPYWAMYIIFIVLDLFPAIYVYILPAIILVLEKRFNFKVLLGFFLFPIFALTWIPIIILGVINRNNKVWNHTEHTRQITIHDLEQA